MDTSPGIPPAGKPNPPITIGLPRARGLAWAASLFDAATGLSTLEQHYRARPVPLDPRAFVHYALGALQIDYRLNAGSLDDIPATGPLLVIANHPYGAAEGLALADLLLQRRADVRLLANTLLCSLPELAPLVVPVDVFKSGVNSASIRAAMRHLKDGGVLIVFPAGEVSRVDWQARQVSDPPWSSTVALLARRGAARVLPLFVEGRPRLRSLAAGTLNSRLRTVMLARDLLAMRGQTLGLRIGANVDPRELARIPEAAQTDFLRVLTYSLGTDRESAAAADSRVLAPLAPRCHAQLLADEVAGLSRYRLLEAGEFELYLAPAAQMPRLLDEIGRLREESFRLLQEGSGLARDLDRFDPHYEHLFLWHPRKCEIVGAYRFGFTDAIVARFGVDGLYTRTLFRYDARLIGQTGPAVELGRSFVAPAWQKSFQPLRLLWGGIAAVLARQPQIRYLFGPVSISPSYSLEARRLIAETLSVHHADPALAGLIEPLHPLPERRQVAAHRNVISALADPRLLSRVISRIGNGPGLPVLLRHYLELNGRFAGFNVDESFGGTLDGLVFVSVAGIPPRTLEHFMSVSGAPTASATTP
ncbi:lysophospholipid acyltransferase family protein [Solimonas terrae]|uniref:L-ornithine N(alpha)-acyltransferase n=1 Tax=Solimonas terrae TaxID=1396819 RepID=A0A6M2BSJ2_9GAMM|nr:GNAT family N-acyltransferase [Solimonas terrae]NGY05458.1 GNAT family N-acetyltransferase [Solimonas terrae]